MNEPVRIVIHGVECPVEDIAVVNLDPNDLVLVRMAESVSPYACREIRNFLRECVFPDNEVLVISAESVSVIRPPQIQLVNALEIVTPPI